MQFNGHKELFITGKLSQFTLHWQECQRVNLDPRHGIRVRQKRNTESCPVFKDEQRSVGALIIFNTSG